MDKSQAKDLFQVQTEIVDLKVEAAVGKAIDKVIDKIDNLKEEMNMRFSSLENRINAVETKLGDRITTLEHRMVAVETKLGIVNETRQAFRDKFMDYTFKAGWLILGGMVSTLLYVTTQLVK